MWCPSCQTEKPPEAWPRNRCRRNGYGDVCLQCANARTALTRWRRKREVINHYGGVCACCGETDLEFLTIDHPNGDGAAERRAAFGERGGAGYKQYCRLKRQGFPPGYRVLCQNCNTAIGYFGYCPHHERRRKDWR